MINFKHEKFEGTLFDLLRICNSQLCSSRERFRAHHDWVAEQLSRPPNLLPIRKGHDYTERGRTVEAGCHRFLIADNEPLASQYEHLLAQREFRGTIGDLLRSGVISASWKSDVLDAAPLRFRGVQASFRRNGLKLAHVFDAAKGLERVVSVDTQLRLRYLRSQSPLNVFLFPNPRVCRFHVRNGFSPKGSDLGEDEFIRGLALGFLAHELCLSPEFWTPFRSGVERIDVEFPQDWETTAREIELAVWPKSTDISEGTSFRVANPRDHGIRTTAAGALDTATTVDRLRAWIASHPEAVQLDGSEVARSNPAKWLHLRIDGVQGRGVFRSRYGPVFDGADYNGVVNFHGDTPVSALRDFVDAVDQAESIHDVLVPSATYEFTSIRRNTKCIKPKFAFKGYVDNVEGFYLYHDEHPGKTIG